MGWLMALLSGVGPDVEPEEYEFCLEHVESEGLLRPWVAMLSRQLDARCASERREMGGAETDSCCMLLHVDVTKPWVWMSSPRG